MTTRTYGLRFMMIVALSTASFFVLAATGGKRKTTKAVTSKKQTTYHSFSLRSGFEFKGRNVLKLQPSSKNSQPQFNSLALIKKNKVTYSVPYNQKQNLKGNNQVKTYNIVEVKVVNIRL
jgi:hypothetical protein